MLHAILQFILMYVAQGALTALIYYLLGKSRASEVTWLTGHIKYNRAFIDIIAAIFMAISVAAFQRHFFFFAHPYTLIVGLVFAVLTLVALGYLRSEYDITWDAREVSGPTSYGIWPFGPTRHTFKWENITGFGSDWAGSFCIVADDGVRIRWSQLYSGHLDLLAHIERMRPDLFE